VKPALVQTGQRGDGRLSQAHFGGESAATLAGGIDVDSTLRCKVDIAKTNKHDQYSMGFF